MYVRVMCIDLDYKVLLKLKKFPQIFEGHFQFFNNYDSIDKGRFLGLNIYLSNDACTDICKISHGTTIYGARVFQESIGNGEEDFGLTSSPEVFRNYLVRHGLEEVLDEMELDIDPSIFSPLPDVSNYVPIGE